MRCSAASLFLLFGLVLLPACSAVDPVDDDGSEPRQLAPAEVRLTTAENAFGLKLFRRLNEGNPPENVILSPLSVSMALGMTLNGARGATRDSMAAALELAGLTQEEINESYGSLIELLSGLDRRVSFELANSIWYRNGFVVQPEFISTNVAHFDAEVEALDFSSPNAPRRINGWVEKKTRGKIDQIVETIDPLTMMYLINAIYFKGAWTHEFDPKATQQEPFTRHDGTAIQVPMMRNELELPFFRGDGFTAVDLPYGDSLYSMTVLLPDEGLDVSALVSNLTDWNVWTGALKTQTVNLRFPRFKAEYEETLNDVLSSLGMGIAFRPFEADFKGINPAPDLHISNVKHKSFIEVNEEGTEAAAVTSVEVGVTSAPMDLVYFHVDRPFVFAIRERHSGTILFLGAIRTL